MQTKTLKAFSAAKLKAAREQKGISQETLARFLFNAGYPCTRQTVTNWELKLSNPPIKAVPFLSEILGQEIGYFFAIEQ